ncbi:MAG: DUF2911 domain-containing protein [Bacteroidota bacterium]
MQRIQKLIGVFSICLGFALVGRAQELPQPSPAAKVEQRIGLTDVSVVYSRPGVKGRTIWGELEKWDVMWRAGANAATLVEFSDDVTVKGNKIPAGKYAFYLTPSQGDWTVTFNQGVENWGVDGYKAEEDVASFKVAATEGPLVERLRYSFENMTNAGGDLVMAWEKVRVAVPIEVDVEKKAWSNIEKALEEAEADKKWRVLRNGAMYCTEMNTRLDQGMEWINESLALHDSWYSLNVKAELQHAQGDTQSARKTMETAIEKGEQWAKDNDQEFDGYRRMLESKMKQFTDGKISN